MPPRSVVRLIAPALSLNPSFRLPRERSRRNPGTLSRPNRRVTLGPHITAQPGCCGNLWPKHSTWVETPRGFRPNSAPRPKHRRQPLSKPRGIRDAGIAGSLARAWSDPWASRRGILDQGVAACPSPALPRHSSRPSRLASTGHVLHRRLARSSAQASRDPRPGRSGMLGPQRWQDRRFRHHRIPGSGLAGSLAQPWYGAWREHGAIMPTHGCAAGKRHWIPEGGWIPKGGFSAGIRHDRAAAMLSGSVSSRRAWRHPASTRRGRRV